MLREFQYNLEKAQQQVRYNFSRNMNSFRSQVNSMARNPNVQQFTRKLLNRVRNF